MWPDNFHRRFGLTRITQIREQINFGLESGGIAVLRTVYKHPTDCAAQRRRTQQFSFIFMKT